MLIRRRLFAYLAFVAIFVWIVVTYYLLIFRTSEPVANQKDMPSLDDRATLLRQQIDALTAELSNQKDENLRLLEIIRNLTISAAVPNKASESPTITTGTLKREELSTRSIAVLVIACNRPGAITNHLDQLLKLRPSKELFPIIVSQDCQHEETTEAIKAYGDQIILIQQPDQGKIEVPVKQKKFLGYYKISRHYHWALNQTFFTYGFNAAIITEDDLDISVDFFEYFAATLNLLDHDPTLWCVSAWNDNGKVGMIEDNPELLYRTDFFPGLGWMLKKSLWKELEPVWPAAYWDDWMRRPDQRKDRACVRPEIPRTAMSQHGKVGVSQGLYFDKHLKLIKLNSQKVFFSKMDLSYLLKDKYDEAFVKLVYSHPSITLAELMAGHLNDGSPLPAAVRLTYLEKTTFKTTAKTLKLMDDFRSGVPRTAYRGIVSFMYGKIRVYLAPTPDWKNYDPAWS